jgi:g-D-glutamyl-meso-diaminopimelate peptidase
MERIIKSIEYTDSSFRKSIKKLKEEYPFLNSFFIGQSCMGRSIPAFKIGNSDKYSLYVAAFHGSERITSTILLMYLEDICYSIKNNLPLEGINIKNVLNKKGIIIVPKINPDGCEISLCGAAAAGAYAKEIKRISAGDTIHWNANLRGVDINHNFSAGWHSLRNMERQMGIYGPSKTRYGGPYPESEPETAALTVLCRNFDISHAIALHSQGKVIYWRYGDKIPKKSEKMVSIMASASGYRPDDPTGLAVGGGFKDWFIETFDRPAFTVEVGLGENPLPAEECENIYNEIKKMLVISSAF